MKKFLLPLAAVGAALALAAGTAEAAPHGTAHVAAYHGGYHGGYYRGGYYRGGYYHGGYYRGGYYRGGWWPGYWGGVGLGVGLGLGAGYWLGNAWYPYDPGYAVADPPVVYSTPQAAAAPVPQAPNPVVYPRNGQSAAQQERDQRACNSWATSQPNAMADGSIFQRAVQACMDGRGYTLK